MTRQAAVYARISSDPGETGLGVARQVKDCAALAADRGWTVAQVYEEHDTSATSGRPRPQYAAMMEALRDGRQTALVVWDVDRLTRTPRELEDVVDLAEQHGVALASVGGEIDLATPQGRLTARIKGSVARHEAEQLRRRVRAKMDEKAAAGSPHGRIAYGWRREPVLDGQGRRLGSRDVIHPEQAAVVRQAAADVLSGESLRAIAARLNAAGVVNLNGNGWVPGTVRSTLLRQRNAGLRVHRGEVVGRGDWEPLWDEAQQRRLTAILTDPARRTSPSSSAVKYLLSGIARCGVCAGPMRVLVAGKDGRKRPTYTCAQRYCVRRSQPELDEHVSLIVIKVLAHKSAPVDLAEGTDEAAQEAQRQIDEWRAQLDGAADLYAAGSIDAQQLARISTPLHQKIRAAEHVARPRIAPDLSSLIGSDALERWAAASLAVRRAAIARLLDVTVRPVSKRGGGFDPRDVAVERKAQGRAAAAPADAG